MSDQFDLNFLDGLSVSCLEDCGYCCLCKPQILPGEDEAFRDGPFEHLIKVTENAEGKSMSFAIQGAYGACALLEDHKCAVYDSRPHMCRQFPVMVFIYDKVQPVPILSCRGLWSQTLVRKLLATLGEDPQQVIDAISEELVDDNSKALLEEPLIELFEREKKTYEEDFYDNELKNVDEQLTVCRKFLGQRGAWIDTEAGRSLLAPVLDRILDRPFLAKAVDLSVTSDLNFVLKKRLNLANVIGSHYAQTNLMDFIRDNEMDIFEQEHMYDLPVFLDRDLSWKVFSLMDDMVEMNKLHLTGSLDGMSSIPFDSIDLLPLDKNAETLGKAYIKYFLETDFAWGVIQLMAADEDNDKHCLNSALQFTISIAADLWWRASMLAMFRGEKEVDAKGMMDGIVFLDMDLLDSWGLGEIV